MHWSIAEVNHWAKVKYLFHNFLTQKAWNLESKLNIFKGHKKCKKIKNTLIEKWMAEIVSCTVRKNLSIVKGSIP